MAKAASILGHIKIDNFGYRTGDYKIAYFTSNPGTTVGVYNASTGQLAYSVPSADITSKGTDTTGITGDTVWWVNFSAFTTSGTYYIYSTSLNEQSYNFQINDCIYQAPMTATLKALYYQRCGCAKPAQYAGVNWSDTSACHLQDETCAPAPGCTFPNSYGTLDLSGGWHDAGDFNKYIGSTPSGSCQSWGGDNGEAIHDLMLAYEWNPTLFTTGQTNIPEPDAGVPDILEEAKWELDWYLKMQMTDKHVLSVVHANGGGGGSPPSTDATVRYYYPPNGDGEAQFVAMLSNSARVMSSVPGLASYATNLRSAAEATWNAYETTWTSDNVKFWAAAEIFRMEEALGGPASIETAAQSFVDTYQSNSWNNFWLNEDLVQQNWGIAAYIESTNATPAVVANMKTDWSTLVNDIFSTTDSYNSALHSWDYSWGADEYKMNYAMELLWGAKLGATGGQSVSQCVQHAEDYLHYMNGANTLNMTLMTNSNAIGASHGIWRIYHEWFGNYYPFGPNPAGPGTYSYDNFIGKPTAVVDPLYPYFSGVDNFGVSDSGPSSFGPPPGIVPDGPSNGYAQQNGQSEPPMLSGGAAPPYEKGYRDWDWVDLNGNESVPWVVNETGLYYTASYFIVASNFTTICSNPTATLTVTMTATNTATETGTDSATNTATNSPTATPTKTSTNTPTFTATNTSTITSTNSMTPTASLTATPTSTNTTTNSPTITPTQTPTNTATVTGTLPPTDTYTNTPTNTSTLTETNTATTTATSTATNSPTITPTNSMTNTATDTATVTSTNTATNTATVTDTYTVTSTFTNTSTATSTLTPTNTPTVTDTLTVTNTATVTSTYTDTNTFTSTFTRTNTSTVTPTYTMTNTPTATFTSTPTNSFTFTFTPLPTSTSTSTPTITPTYTATVSSVIVISQSFPNPSNGSPISFSVNVPSQSTVTLDVFTTAFRKIRSQTAKVYGFQTLQWDLKDTKGTQSADGLYYVRVQVTGTKSASKILKVLILR